MAQTLIIVLEYPEEQEKYYLQNVDMDYQTIVSKVTKAVVRWLLTPCPLLTNIYNIHTYTAHLIYKLHDEMGLLGDAQWMVSTILDYLTNRLLVVLGELRPHVNLNSDTYYKHEIRVSTIGYKSFYTLDILIGEKYEHG